MARPSIRELEEGDRFGVQEATRILRKHLRRADLALVKTPITADRAAPLIELIAKINGLLLGNELHKANLLRNPPARARKPPTTTP